MLVLLSPKRCVYLYVYTPGGTCNFLRPNNGNSLEATNHELTPADTSVHHERLLRVQHTTRIKKAILHCNFDLCRLWLANVSANHMTCPRWLFWLWRYNCMLFSTTKKASCKWFCVFKSCFQSRLFYTNAQPPSCFSGRTKDALSASANTPPAAWLLFITLYQQGTCKSVKL